MAEIDTIAKQFTDFYYAKFDSNRAELAPLYRPESMLTFEGQQVQGSGIVAKLTDLPFAKVVHKVTTIDAQPSSPSVASLIVSVTGLLLVDDGTNPLHFSQVFHLMPFESGYYVLNDIFRLNYS